MRKRIIVASAIALVGVLGLALLSVNFLIRRNKDFLIDWAEQALGRKISAERIEVTFWPAGARLSEFALADDPTFSTEDFLRANSARMELQLLPLLIGQFRPKTITLESPTITVVRDAQGRYNFASRGRSEKGADGRNKLRGEQADRPLLVLPAVNISDGALRFRDLTDGSELTATQIALKISAFEADEPFEIQLEAVVMAAKPNLQLKTWIGSIAENHDFRDVPLAGELNATELDLGRVNKALPQFRRAIPKMLRFDGIYTIKELKFKGTLNNLSLKGAVTGTDASFRFE